LRVPKANNYKNKDGKFVAKYKTGQLALIYRPLIIDATGKKVWGEIFIDVKNRIEHENCFEYEIELRLPINFAENASYPIRIDPYIGSTSRGSINITNSTKYLSTNVSAITSDGVLDKVYSWTPSPSNFKVGVYDNTGVGNTGDLLAGAVLDTLEDAGTNLYSADVSAAAAALTNGETYYPVNIPDNALQYYASGAPYSPYLAGTDWANEPFSQNSGFAAGFVNISVYAEYSEPTYGSLQVNIDPSAARTNGRWRRTSTSNWYSHATVESDVAVGTYSVEFLDVSGFSSPATISGVIVAESATIATTGTYIELGTLQVNIDPSAARTNGRWRRTSTSNWYSHASTESLVAGTYDVEFLDAVSGYDQPSNITNISVSSGATTATTGTYNELPVVVINTPAANPYNSSLATEVVSGIATDNDGSIASVGYSTDRGHSGTCSGTGSWTANIPIETGSNTVTITATDNDYDTGTDTILITRGSLTGWVQDDTAKTMVCGGLTNAYFEQDAVDFDSSLSIGNEYICIVDVTAYSYGDLILSSICTNTALNITGTGIWAVKVTCSSSTAALRVLTNASTGFDGTLKRVEIWDIGT